MFTKHAVRMLTKDNIYLVALGEGLPKDQQ